MDAQVAILLEDLPSFHHLEQPRQHDLGLLLRHVAGHVSLVAVIVRCDNGPGIIKDPVPLLGYFVCRHA
jgi:hypothetical protein